MHSIVLCSILKFLQNLTHLVTTVEEELMNTNIKNVDEPISNCYTVNEKTISTQTLLKFVLIICINLF